MTDVMPGGRRRLDRILSGPYRDTLTTVSAATLRARRREIQAEEIELAYLLNLLHDRLATIHTEQNRRKNGTVALPHALPEQRRGPVRYLAKSLGLGRQFVNRPDLPPRDRRRVERLLHDVDMSDVHQRTDDELARVLKTFETAEQHVREVHHQVQLVLDACISELAQRYTADTPAQRTA